MHPLLVALFPAGESGVQTLSKQPSESCENCENCENRGSRGKTGHFPPRQRTTARNSTRPRSLESTRRRPRASLALTGSPLAAPLAPERELARRRPDGEDFSAPSLCAAPPTLALLACAIAARALLGRLVRPRDGSPSHSLTAGGVLRPGVRGSSADCGTPGARAAACRATWQLRRLGRPGSARKQPLHRGNLLSRRARPGRFPWRLRDS